MNEVTMEDFKLKTSNKKELACSRLGAKVLFDEIKKEIIKVFPAKERSMYFYKPDIFSFIDNAKNLQEKKINTICITGAFHVMSSYIFYVTYKPVEGISVRDHLKKNPRDRNIIKKLAKFFATLHNSGVYFRSIHLGNIIIQPDQEFALIDIASMHCQKKSLSVFLRARNFQIFCRARYNEDFMNLLRYDFNLFIKDYLKYSSLKIWKKKFFLKLLLFYNPKYIQAFQNTITT